MFLRRSQMIAATIAALCLVIAGSAALAVSGPARVFSTSQTPIYFPLAEGNEWVYEEIRFDYFGPFELGQSKPNVVTQDFGNRVRTARITGVENYNGVTAFVWDRGGEESPTFALANSEQGLVCWRMGGQIFPTAQPFIIYPFTQGASWIIGDTNSDAIKFTVLATDEYVDVDAGEFSGCIKLKVEFYRPQDAPPPMLYAGPKLQALSNEFTIIWVAPFIGIVKEENYEMQGGFPMIRSRDELISFSVLIPDETPPPAPVVADDGDTSYGNALGAYWSCEDPDSGIASFQAAVSSTPNESGILQYDDGSSAIFNVGRFFGGCSYALPLEEGGTYYILVKALNNGGLWSDWGVSDGITVSLTPPTNDILPLALNNCWKYEVQSPFSQEPEEGEIKVERVKEEDGIKYFDVDVDIFDGDIDRQSVSLARVRQGFKLYKLGDREVSPPAIFLKWPVRVGESWSWDFPGIECSSTFTCQSLNEPVETPAGLFEGCVKICEERCDSGSYAYYYYKPGIGLVKIEEFQDEENVGNAVLTAWKILDSEPPPPADTTPPTTPVVADAGSVSRGNVLWGSWSSQDPESGIISYLVAISTTPNESGIVEDWQWDLCGDQTEGYTPPLNLVNGQTYYILVKATNSEGLTSEWGVSDGIQVFTSPTGTDLLPLAVGNYWEYDTECYEEDDLVESDGDDYDKDYIKVIDSSVSGSVNLFDTEVCFEEEPFVISLGRGTNGIMIYKFNGVPVPTPPGPQLFLKLPATVGTTWSWMEPGDDGPEFNQCRVMSVTDTVETPAGTFRNCVRVRIDHVTFGDYDLMWFAPGIGLVKNELWDTNGTTSTADDELLEVRTLKAWHLQPAPAAPDTTPPTKPTVTLASTIVYGNSVQASWSAQDNESGISEYQAAVSTSTSVSGILPETDWVSFGAATSGTLEDLPLQSGSTYYVLVKAKNGAGLWSQVGVSAAFKAEKEVGRIEISFVGVESEPIVRCQESGQFSAKVYDVDDIEMKGKTVIWSCEQEAGTITSSGRFTAGCNVGFYPGAVTATVFGSDVSESVDVEVIPGQPYQVVIDPAVVSVEAGTEQEFTATVFDRCGNEVPTATVYWSCKNPKAGTINSEGLFTAGTTPGKYPNVIQVMCGSKKAMASVTVTPTAPDYVEITPEVSTVEVGKTVRFKATAYKDDQPMSRFKFNWYIDEPPNVQGNIGKINKTSGAFTAGRTPASGIILAQAVYAGEEFGEPGILEITTVPGPVNKVIVTDADGVPVTTKIIPLGSTFQFAYKAYDKFNNFIQDHGLPVVWSVSSAALGTIDQDGLFTTGTKAASGSVTVKVGTKSGRASIKTLTVVTK